MDFIFGVITVASLTIVVVGMICKTIQADKAKKKMEDRIKSLEHRVRTLEIWILYVTQKKD